MARELILGKHPLDCLPEKLRRFFLEQLCGIGGFKTARLLRQRLRDSDIVGRYGGEEFAVILPDCNQGQAIAIMDQLRESFGNIDFQVGDTTFNTTFSCGVASLSRFDTSIALGKAADEALYAAKNGGRNRVAAA
jgi:diguanylate cyclase (GGDEF)-like protein